MEFVETPLSDVVDYLRDKYAIPIVLDKKAMDDSSITADTPVNCMLTRIPLRSALDLVLRPLGLTWTIRSDVLMITTPEADEQNLVVKTCDVSDLLETVSDQPYRGGLTSDATKDPGVTGYLGGGYSTGGSMGGYAFYPGSMPSESRRPTEARIENLKDLVTTCVAPNSWEYRRWCRRQRGFPGPVAGHKTDLHGPPRGGEPSGRASQAAVGANASSSISSGCGSTRSSTSSSSATPSRRPDGPRWPSMRKHSTRSAGRSPASAAESRA